MACSDCSKSFRKRQINNNSHESVYWPQDQHLPHVCRMNPPLQPPHNNIFPRSIGGRESTLAVQHPRHTAYKLTLRDVVFHFVRNWKKNKILSIYIRCTTPSSRISYTLWYRHTPYHPIKVTASSARRCPRRHVSQHNRRLYTIAVDGKKWKKKKKTIENIKHLDKWKEKECKAFQFCKSTFPLISKCLLYVSTTPHLVSSRKL